MMRNRSPVYQGTCLVLVAKGGRVSKDFPIKRVVFGEAWLAVRAMMASLAAIAAVMVAGGPELADAQTRVVLCSNGIVVANPEENGELVADCATLLAIEDRLAGDATLNWSPQLPLEEWQGLGVDAEADPARVWGLVLNGHGQLNVLTGSIPAELGELSGLESLELPGNRLTGTIPPELGRLTRLRSLRLNHNRLTGPIPEELGEITGLRSLELNENMLTGLIPARLGRLTELESLHLDNNRLTGDIPTALSRLTNLWVLWLGGNQLGGCMPRFLDSRGGNDLAALGMPFCSHQARLDACRESQALAAQRENEGLIRDCAALLEIRDRLAGDATLNWSAQLPIEEWEGIVVRAEVPPGAPRVTRLGLVERGLTGFTPAAIGRLTRLRWLWLGGNRLTGEIPSELGNLPHLRILNLFENQLAGEIPKSLGRLANLAYLNLNGNQLTGAIPSELGSLSRLIELSLPGNKLTGAIPAELGGLLGLQWLDLSDNLLTGEIPAELGNLTNLQELYLHENELTGCIPETVRTVGISDHSETGLPFCDLVALCSNETAVANPQENDGLVADCAVLLELRDKLTGEATLNWSEQFSIRQWKGVGIDGTTEPPRVTELKLVDRGLTGGIPVGISGLANLQILDLSWNSLAGTVPENLNHLSNLRTLRLAGNQLSGCLPQTWRNVEDSDLAETGMQFCE